MQVPFKLCEGNINLSHTKPCLKKPRHLGMLTFFKQGLNADQMETEICETGLRQARRFAQRIMERYGQGKQRSMAQFRPQRLSGFLSGVSMKSQPFLNGFLFRFLNYSALT